MIALRAAHQAFRIATDLGYEPIDPTLVKCSNCSRDLRGETVWQDFSIRCPDCGTLNELPVHLRGPYLLPEEPPPQTDQIRPRYTSGERIVFLFLLAFTIAVIFVFIYAAFYG